MNPTGAATTHPSPTAEFAEACGEVLAALAGPEARLREDQLSAIDALVTHGERVLLVQAPDRHDLQPADDLLDEGRRHGDRLDDRHTRPPAHSTPPNRSA